MAGEVFGATLSLRDNVSGVLRAARDSSRGFRGAVEKAKQELKRLEQQKLQEKTLRIKNTAAYKAIEGVRRKLEPITKKVVEIKAREELAVARIKKVVRKLAEIKDNKVVNFAVKGAEKATKALGKAALAGTAAAMAAVTAAGAGAVVSAVNFQAQMKNVGTLLDGDVNAKLQAMGDDLKKVSLQTGAATTDLTAGLYDVVSAFGESAESVKQLEIASKAAKAGNATTSDSVALLSAVTKGYGDTSAAAMQKASDLAFQTVKLGQTTFPELASSLGQVVPLASTLAVTQEELFGAMATLTGVTGGTAEVTTQLKATMQSFLSPSGEMEKALKKMGYASGAAALEQEGLGGILDKLKESVNGDQVAFANLFSSVEAKNAVLALTGAQAENFASKTEQMKDAAGAADMAFQTQASSVKEMANRVKNAGQVMLTSLGERTLPYITSGLEKLSAKLPEMEAAFDQAAAYIGPVMDTVGSALSGVCESWKPVLDQMGGSFMEAFSQARPAVESLVTSVSGMVPYIQPVVSAISGMIASAIPVAAELFAGLGSVVSSVFPAISQVITGVAGKLQGAFSAISGSTGTLRSIFDAAGPAISGVITGIWTVAGPVLDLIITGVKLAAAAFQKSFPVIQSVVESVWKVVGPIFDWIGKGVSAVAGAVDAAASFLGGGSEGSGQPKGTKHNATGTAYFSGGWTQVGEHGPEMMQLPAGTKIKSNLDTSNMQAMGGMGQTAQVIKKGDVNITIQRMEVREEADVDKVAAAIIRKIEEAESNM